MNKNILIAILSAIITAIVLLGVFIWWQKNQNSANEFKVDSIKENNLKNNNSDNILLDNKINSSKQNSEFNTLIKDSRDNEDNLETVKIESSLVPKGRVEISMKVPVKWDVFVGKPINYIHDGKNILAKFSFKDDYGKGSAHTNESKLAIYDITDWITIDETGGGPGALSLIDKKRMVEGLADYKKTKQISEYCPFYHIGRRLKNTAIYTKTVDDKFSGCAIVTVSPQDPSYDPHLIVEMVGEINGRYIYVDGQFKLHDHFVREMNDSSVEISEYLKKFDNIMKNVNDNGLPVESQKEFNDILQVVSSLNVTEIK
jgi:hypothetical protein